MFARSAPNEPLKRALDAEEIAAMRDAAREEGSLRERLFPALRRVLANAPFAADVLAAWYCATDPATPARTKLILFGALGYFIAPLDAIPDFLPLIGFTDDAAVIAAALAAVRLSMTDEHRDAARARVEALRRGSA